MIRFFKTEDTNAVIEIWQEAFGDKAEYIKSFIDFFGKYIVISEQNGTPVAIMTLIPTQIGEKNGRYVYAVATAKKFQKLGYATKMIEFAKDFISSNNEEFLVLLPAGDSLFGFYQKCGFSDFSLKFLAVA